MRGDGGRLSPSPQSSPIKGGEKQLIPKINLEEVVVHLSSGIAALAACLMIGKRKGYLHQLMSPHSLPMTILGTALLWFGWFGFNAGSSLTSSGLAVSAFVVTNTSAAAAAITWAILEWRYRSTPTVLGTATGAIAGLATITPTSGFVSPLSAITIGVAAGIISYLAVSWRPFSLSTFSLSPQLTNALRK